MDARLPTTTVDLPVAPLFAGDRRYRALVLVLCARTDHSNRIGQPLGYASK